jgi:opacity protein-like surface antigen
MKTKYRAMVSVCGAAVLAVVLVPAASACGAPGPAFFEGPFAIQQLKADSKNPLEGVSAESLLRDQRASGNGSPASIVGMWKITELSMGNTTHNPPIPDGTQIDFGYAQWHSDGTEFYNSGGFAPATQNYCLGVWAATGTNTYQVNHFALTYDMTGVYTGIINILETLTISPGGTRYSGTFTINAYDTKGNQVNHLTGQVTGVRVTLDTTP